MGGRPLRVLARQVDGGNFKEKLFEAEKVPLKWTSVASSAFVFKGCERRLGTVQAFEVHFRLQEALYHAIDMYRSMRRLYLHTMLLFAQPPSTSPFGLSAEPPAFGREEQLGSRRRGACRDVAGAARYGRLGRRGQGRKRLERE